MDIRKRIILIFFCLAIVYFLLSCGKSDTTLNENSASRIKLKETIFIEEAGRTRFSIIEVDSIEYLTQNGGGFIRISK